MWNWGHASCRAGSARRPFIPPPQGRPINSGIPTISLWNDEMSDQSLSQQAEDCAKGLLMPENRHARIRLAALAGFDVLAAACLISQTWNAKPYSYWLSAIFLVFFCTVIATAGIRRTHWIRHPPIRMTYFQALLIGVPCVAIALLTAITMIYRINTHALKLLVTVFVATYVCLQIYNYWRLSRNGTANHGSS